MIERIKTTRIFADGADLDSIVDLASNPLIAGFTTNPTLMRSAGLSDYESFARLLLEKVTIHPVSLEVCADEALEIRRQAEIIASWGENVFVKLPITSTRGEDLTPIAHELSYCGVKVNVTAVFTSEQATSAISALNGGAPSFVSVFAGRIADAGVDPLPIVADAVVAANSCRGPEIIWASSREVFNLLQAESVGCHVITMTPELLKKLGNIGKDLEQFSRETVEMFFRDAQASGLTV